MIVNDIQFAFDSSKLSDLDRYEKAYEALKPSIEKGDALVKEGKLASASRTYLAGFKAFFIEMAGVDVVGDTEDYILCRAYFEDFSQQLAEQKQKAHDAYFSRKKGRK